MHTARLFTLAAQSLRSQFASFARVPTGSVVRNAN